MIDMTAFLSTFSATETGNVAAPGKQAKGKTADGQSFSDIFAGHTQKLAASQTKAPRQQPQNVKNTEAKPQEAPKTEQDSEPELTAYEAAAAQNAASQNQVQNPTDQTEADASNDMEVNSVAAPATEAPSGFFTQALLTMLGNVDERDAFMNLMEQLGMEMPADDSPKSFEDLIAKLLENLDAQTVTMTWSTGSEVNVTRVSDTYKELAALMNPVFAVPADVITDELKPGADSISLPLMTLETQEENPLPMLKTTLENLLSEIRAYTEKPAAELPQDEVPVVTETPEQPVEMASVETDVQPAETEEAVAAPKVTDESGDTEFSSLLGPKESAPISASAVLPQENTATGPAGQADIIRQLTQAAPMMKNDGTSTLEIQLHPAHLGKVSILLEHGPEGVTAQFKAENDHVRGMLSAGLADLTASLKGLGVNMKNIEVSQNELGWDFARGSMQNQQGERQNGEQQQPNKRPASPAQRVAAAGLAGQAIYGASQTRPFTDENTSVEFIA